MTVEVTAEFRKAELDWAKKQIEYERFERKQHRQRNDLVWIVKKGGGYLVTERGQLRYTKADIFTSLNEAKTAANKRLGTRLIAEDTANPANTYVREVLIRDTKDE